MRPGASEIAMKISKKILAVLLAAIMLFSLSCIVALAEDETPDEGTSTTVQDVENPDEDETDVSETEEVTLIPPEIETAVSELGDQVRENNEFFYNLFGWFNELLQFIRDFFDNFSETYQDLPGIQEIFSRWKFA